MTSINCIVVDDEPIARDIIISHVAATPGLELVKSCMSASEAYEGLHQFKVDLIFLDIQMPVITGTDFLRSLRNPPFVVFTTAYHNYAVEGFELNSVDYLLKPITYERFYQAVQKVKERLTAKNATQQNVTPSLPAATYLFIKQDTKLVRVNHSQISYIQAERDFSSVYVDGKRMFASMHLKLFEDTLPDVAFMRVHRSYIINLSKVKSIKGNTIELEAIEIPIGANYKEQLFSRLGI
jgi:DNA-binding LytR/AlgR family response regulator